MIIMPNSLGTNLLYFGQQLILSTMLKRPTSCVMICREMSRIKRRHTVPPFWLPQTTKTMYPERITKANESFVSEVIANKYASPLRIEPFEREAWNAQSIRCGLIAKKIGIYPMWTKDGTRILTTLLQVSDNHVIKYISPEELSNNEFKSKLHTGKRSIGALIIGADSSDPRNFTKEYYNLFADAGVMPKKRISKFYITPDAKLPPGTPLYASHFRPGDYVDIAGFTIDRGFQGVMKRWGFKGLPASHGVTKSHRRGGNIGGGGEKARVWPGKKMPGHMGREYRVLRGVKIWRINTVSNVLYVSGPAIPGPTGAYVYMYDTLLPNRKETRTLPPFPTMFQDEVDIDEELFDESFHEFTKPSITFNE